VNPTVYPRCIIRCIQVICLQSEPVMNLFIQKASFMCLVQTSGSYFSFGT